MLPDRLLCIYVSEAFVNEPEFFVCNIYWSGIEQLSVSTLKAMFSDYQMLLADDGQNYSSMTDQIS